MMKVYNKRQIKNSIKFCNLCILILGLFYSTALHSQCATPIAVTPGTPYIENFETNPAWTTGGTEDDWAWGTPTKATINGAGSGSNQNKDACGIRPALGIDIRVKEQRH